MGLVFIVGAGASVAPPAELPLFGALRERLLDELQINGELRQLAAELAPETFMRAIYNGQLELEPWLTNTLARGHPNAVHHVLAQALEQGATIWTVSVDELIERAAHEQKRNVVATAYPEQQPPLEARLLKPHGTVTNGQYLFRADQVVQPLAPGWARRLRDDLNDSEVVVVGYAGLDVDLRLALGTAFENASSVTWFETDDKREALHARFPALATLWVPETHPVR